MGLSSWLKERRLERTHAKLKHLRSMQARIREQIETLHKDPRGASRETLDARERKLIDEKEKLTRTIHELEGAEKRLKTELDAPA